MPDSTNYNIEMEFGTDQSISPIKRPRGRKSRAKGLRARTGCITCRKRHLKCDELKPTCTHCSKSDRECNYESTSSNSSSSQATSFVPEARILGSPEFVFEQTRQTISIDDVMHPDQNVAIHPIRTDDTLRRTHTLTPNFISENYDLNVELVQEQLDHELQGEREHEHVLSPANTDRLSLASGSSTRYLSAEVAPLRWLGLLASDAARADENFSLTPFTPQNADQPQEFSYTGENFHPRQAQPTDAFTPARIDPVAAINRILNPSNFVTSRPASASGRSERLLWQEKESISLLDHEIPIFRNFVEKVSLWIDLFDPLNHFSTLVPRLALRNAGLMKAILACSARHLSLNSASATHPLQDRNFAVQYYFETLHYLQTALQYESYIRSSELIATAIIVSTYEMMDGSNSGWERHLKGVFWIQRSQDIDGDSGGIKQAVWWAWLRQDVWASFRERRRAFSFWKPTRPHSALTQHELANRSVYLLAQAVNYCSDEETEAGKPHFQKRVDRCNTLLDMLDDWYQTLGDEFKPLPTIRKDEEFEPLWYHPPQFGVALQIHAFAKILLLLHRPSTGGYKDYLASQRTLSECVNVICGIALTQIDDACNLISTQCLYGAALSVADAKKRCAIEDLIETCQRRTGWPIASLADELRRELDQSDA